MNDPLLYASLAKAAYSAAPTIGVEESSARAILDTTADGLTVTFPGTNNVACWLADLDVEVVTVRGLGTVHAGFWNALQSIQSQLMQHEPAVTNGHSEGAALALLHAGVLCLAGKPPAAVYAFEPPRLTIDETLRDLLAKHQVKVLMTQNGNDVVPMVPRLLHEWRQPGKLTMIGRASEPFPNVEDHFIDRVIEALNG